MEFTNWALIGGSSFVGSNIILAKDSNGTDCVFKRTNLEICESNSFSALSNEISYCKNLRHENILSIQSAFVYGKYLYVKKELMSLGSCVDLMQAKFKYGLPERAISLIMYDVMNALEYIHNMLCIHRGVKGSHILLSADGRVKLCGHRSMISMVKNGVKKTVLHHYPKEETPLLPWLSPEILQQNKQGYGPKSDIYSLGITACELANGCAPFTDMTPTQMLLSKLNGHMPFILDKTTIPVDFISTENDSEEEDLYNTKKVTSEREFSAEFHEFSKSCLEKDIDRRPFLYLLQRHDFVCAKNPEASRHEIFAELIEGIFSISSETIGQDDEFLIDIEQNMDGLNISEDWEF